MAGAELGPQRPEEFVRLIVDNPDNGHQDSIVLGIPHGLDVDDSARRWQESGGQVRQFRGSVVDQQTVGWVDWLIKAEGAQMLQPDISGEQN